MATQQSEDMTASKKICDIPKIRGANNCVKQASTEIVLFMVTMLTRNLGMQVDVSEISEKENLKEEIHGCFEVGIQQCEKDDGKISNDVRHIRYKQEKEDDNSPLWVICQSKKNEGCHQCVISHM